MPVRGAKPQPTHRHRNKSPLDWTEVEDVPFLDPPRLPRMGDGKSWPAQTRRWWKTISSMPHCALWTDSDWQFAFDSALVAAAFHLGDLRQADPLLKREKIMGTTIDFRRDLRIRYIPAGEPQDQPAGVTVLEEYRKALQE